MGKGGNNKCSRSQMSMDAGAASGVGETLERVVASNRGTAPWNVLGTTDWNHLAGTPKTKTFLDPATRDSPHKRAAEALTAQAHQAQLVPENQRADWLDQSYRQAVSGDSDAAPSPVVSLLGCDSQSLDRKGFEPDALAYQVMRAQGQINAALGRNPYGYNPRTDELARYLLCDPTSEADVEALLRSSISPAYFDRKVGHALRQRLKRDLPVTAVFTPEVLDHMAAANQEGIKTSRLAEIVAQAHKDGEDPAAAIRQEVLDVRVPQAKRLGSRNADFVFSSGGVSTPVNSPESQVGLYYKHDPMGEQGRAKEVKHFRGTTPESQAEAAAYHEEMTQRSNHLKARTEERLEKTCSMLDSLRVQFRAASRQLPSS